MGANANSSLLQGAEEGNLEKVQKSLEAGADPNVKDSSGLDPLTWAAKKGHAAIAKVLLEKGASAEEEDKENLLPLHHAALKGRDKCLAAMLVRGCTPTVPLIPLHSRIVARTHFLFDFRRPASK